MMNKKKIILFNYISKEYKFINILKLKELFEEKYNFDFYDKIHKNINFDFENFSNYENIFKYFYNNYSNYRIIILKILLFINIIYLKKK